MMEAVLKYCVDNKYLRKFELSYVKLWGLYKGTELSEI